MKKNFYIALLILFVSIATMAVPPAPWNPLKGPAADHHSYEEFLQKRNAPRALNAPSPIGTTKVLVIRAEFTDVSMTNTQASYAESFCSNVASYYNENSYGKCTLQFTVSPTIYTMPGTLASYGGDGGPSNIDPNGYKVIEDAILAADGDFDYSQFDLYMVFHAGYGQETDDGSNTDDLWSMSWSGMNISTADSITITKGTVVPEMERNGASALGVIAHELGHDLGDLPDLYDTDYSSDGIGKWGMMSAGTWLGSGSTPAHFCGWSKIQMGWLTPTVISSNQTGYSLNSISTNESILKLAVSGQEYFLIENRYKTTGFDSALPGTGILITHVDESITTNTNDTHRLVDVEEADNNNELDTNGGNQGEAGDLYVIGATFSPASSPNSNYYSGSSSDLTLSNFSASASTMTVDIQVSSVNAPIFASINTADTLNIPKTAFDIEDTVRVRFVESSPSEASTGTVVITGPGGYNSGSLSASFDGTVNYMYDWDSTGREAGSYTATATLTNSAGSTNDSTNFTLSSQAPGPVTLIAPTDGTTINTLTPQFTWTDNGSDEESYTIEIDDTSDFSSIIHTHTTADGDTVSYDLPAAILSDGNIYYWRVYATKGTYFDKDSAVKRSFTVDVDLDAPTIQSTSPADSEIDVVADKTITIVFSEKLDPTTVNTSNIYLRQGATDITSTVSYDDNLKQVTLTPSQTLDFETNYTVYVSTSITDVAGNALASTYSFSFDTELYPAPLTFSVIDSPGDNGEYYHVEWNNPSSPVNVYDKISTYQFYYIQKDTIFVEGDISSATLISWTKAEVGAAPSAEVNIVGSTTNNYTFALRYTTTDGKTSKLVYAAPLMSENDATVVSNAVYEIQPQRTIPAYDTTFTFTMIPDFGSSTDAGFDRIYLHAANMSGHDFSAAKFYVNNSEYTLDASPSGDEFTASVTGDTIEVKIGKVLDDDITGEQVKFVYDAQVSGSSGDDITIDVILKHSVYNTASTAADLTEGNADGNSENDNDGSVTVANLVNSVTAEILPTQYAVNSTSEVSLYALLYSDSNSIGVDTLSFTLPDDYFPQDTSEWQIFVNSVEVDDNQYSIDVSGYTSTLTFSNVYTGNVSFLLKYVMQAPAVADIGSGGEVITGSMDNSAINIPVNFTTGDANGTSGDSDVLTVKTGKIMEQMTAEVYPFIVSGNSTTEFTMTLKPYINSDNFGLDKIYLNFGTNFSNFQGATVEIEGTGTLATRTSGAPSAGEVLVADAVENDNSIYAELTFGDLIDTSYHDKLITVKFKLDAADTNSSGEEITTLIKNTDIGGELAASAGDADTDPSNNPTILTDSLKIKIQKPANNVYSEISPHKVVASESAKLKYYINADIDSSTNSGVNTIKIELPSTYKVLSETNEIALYVNSALQVISNSTPSAGQYKVSIDTNENIISLLTGTTYDSDRDFRVEFMVDPPSNLDNGLLFKAYVDNSVSTSPQLGVDSDQDGVSGNGDDNTVTTGRISAVSLCELYVPPAVEKANSVVYGSTDNKAYITAAPVIQTGNFGFDRLYIGIPDEISNIDTTTATLVIGEISFTTVSAAPDTEEVRLTYSPQTASSGGTLEVEFGRLIDVDWPVNKKVVLTFEFDAPTTEDTYTFTMYSANSEISTDIKQSFTPGNTYVADHPTQTMDIEVVKTPALASTAEIHPAHVRPSVDGQQIVISTKLDFNTNNSGVKYLRVVYPTSYSDIKLTSADGAKVEVDTTDYSISSNTNPIGNMVYIDYQTQNNYFDLKFGTVLKDTTTGNIVKITFKADTPTVQDAPGGGTFEVYAYTVAPANDVVSQKATPGDVSGNPSVFNGMNIIAANSVSSVVSELNIKSSNGSFTGDNENLVMVNSTGNILDYYMKLDFASGNRGINLLAINIPSTYSNIQNVKVYDGQVELSADYREESDVLYVSLDTPVSADSTLKVSMEINAPTSTDTGVDFTSYADYHFEEAAAYWLTDNLDFAVSSQQGEASSEADSESYTVTCVTTPATQAVAEIYPDTTYINKDDQAFTLTILPTILDYSSGVDKVNVKLPGNLSDIEITSLSAKGGILPTTDYTTSVSGNSYTFLLNSKVVFADAPNHKIIMAFTADTSSKSVYTTNEVEVYVSDSLNDRQIKATEGNAGATNSTLSLQIDSKAAISVAGGYITPNYMLKNSADQEFEVSVDMQFNSNDEGLKKLRLQIPTEFDNNTDFGSSEVSVAGDSYDVITVGFPAANEVLLDYDELNHYVYLTFGSSVKENGTLKFSFVLDAPTTDTAYNKQFQLTVIDDINLFTQTIDEKYTNSLYVSTENAELDINNLVSSIEADGNGNWEIYLKIPFNVTMDVFYPSPAVYVNGVKASIVSYKNLAFPTTSDPEVGIIEAKVDVPYEKFVGSSSNTLSISNVRDERGNVVDTITKVLDLGYGIGLSVFLNPADSKTITMVSKLSHPLSTGLTLKFEAIEFQGTPERIRALKKTSDLYSGVYSIESDGTPIITAGIYDSNEVRLQMVSKEINTILLSPVKDKAVNTLAGQMLFKKGSVVKDGFAVISEASFKENNKQLRVDKVFDLAINQKLTSPVMLRNDHSNAVLFKLRDNKLISPVASYDGSFKIRNSGRYVVARYTGKPIEKRWEIDGNNIFYEYADDQSSIKDVFAQIDGQEFSQVPHKGRLALPVGIHQIDFKAVDLAGNELKRSTTVRIAPASLITGMAVYPNPASSFAEIRFTAPAGSRVSLKIYDVSGRLIYRARTTAAGVNQSMIWDLADKRGRYVANGVYFYKVKVESGSDHHEVEGKFAVIR
ncbi:MAG: hypothetical protein C0601_04670 [Candidatus Muiribacterium halophilum]|uniref:Fibronectin type-III domain-containing protein n=1 Tax=Muiribacterium halophilum TaxID=2053465 RepID=A0A2N5ZI55_MUIH1|nr:MAG: hypothetical protein C0601_04670 [Candidatus Muirbacterium halophilum]